MVCGLWRSLTSTDRWTIPNCTSKKKNIMISVFKLQQKYTGLCDQKRFVLRIISVIIILWIQFRMQQVWSPKFSSTHKRKISTYSYLGKLLFLYTRFFLFVVTWLSVLPVCDGGNKAKRDKLV